MEESDEDLVIPPRPSKKRRRMVVDSDSESAEFIPEPESPRSPKHSPENRARTQATGQTPKLKRLNIKSNDSSPKAAPKASPKASPKGRVRPKRGQPIPKQESEEEEEEKFFAGLAFVVSGIFTSVTREKVE